MADDKPNNYVLGMNLDIAKEKPVMQSYEDWKVDPQPQKLRKVVDDLDPVINSAVRQYAGQKAPPTVLQRARLIAAKAVRSYDSTRGADIKTHVFNQMRSIQRMAPGISNPLSPPERFRRDQQEIDTSYKELEDVLGREPTDEEISEMTGLPVRRVIKVRTRMRARIPISAYEDKDDDDDSNYDIVGSKRDDFDDWLDAVYDELGPVDRLIMMYRTGYRGSEIYPNSVIAKKLNISPSAISQRASRIQSKLDSFYGR
jgi:DNA-directed RNA polymerase specialized sigma subunit